MERHKSFVLGRPTENDELRAVASRVTERYSEQCELIKATLLVRGPKCPECLPSPVRTSRALYRKRVSFDCSSPFSERSEALPELEESRRRKKACFKASTWCQTGKVSRERPAQGCEKLLTPVTTLQMAMARFLPVRE
ncbi:hypothetical protein PI124_g20936 [Phytophthora idaei]|nr:hypothetical protein PI125_g18578 [Phytophthora idaei]KAG3234002.1 hypothetical protein PI124_g20936 [Phytophthora idaei]